MGVGLYISSKIPRIGLFRKAMEKQELFEVFSRELKSCLPEELKKFIFETQVDGNELRVQLHPAEEPVSFIIDKEIVRCYAKTNSAGPGYHAFLVEALQKIEHNTKLKWNWKNDDNDSHDDVGYSVTGDFGKLQYQMLEWLREVSKYFIENVRENIMISMPTGYPLVESDLILSPMGFWDKEWLTETANSQIEELYGKGKEFFPWWDKGFGADFFKNCALAIMWVELPWHSHVDEYELGLYQFVLDCFNKARELDCHILVPEEEIIKIKEYVKEDNLAQAPEAQGIGFKKRLMRRNLTGSWTAMIPGYFYSDLENDGTTAVYWFRDRTIRGSSFSMRGRDGNSITAEQLVGDKPNSSSVYEYDEGHIKGYATIERAKEGEQEYFNLTGKMAAPNNACLVTVCYNKEEDKDWAIETWKSVLLTP